MHEIVMDAVGQRNNDVVVFFYIFNHNGQLVLPFEYDFELPCFFFFFTSLCLTYLTRVSSLFLCVQFRFRFTVYVHYVPESNTHSGRGE